MGSRNIAHRFYVMDTEAFDFVLGTNFFVQHSQIQSLTLQLCATGAVGTYLCNGSSDSTQLYTDVIRISMILRCTLVQ